MDCNRPATFAGLSLTPMEFVNLNEAAAILPTARKIKPKPNRVPTPVEIPQKQEYILSTVFQDTNLSGLFVECATLGKMHNKVKAAAMLFELGLLNQKLAEDLNQFSVGILERELTSEKSLLDDVETKIQIRTHGWKSLGNRRDKCRAKIVEIAKRSASFATKKNQIEEIGDKMTRIADTIEGLGIIPQQNSLSIDDVPLQDRDRDVSELFSSPNPENRVILETPWMIEFINKVPNLKTEIESVSMAVSKLGTKMDSLVESVSPKSMSVINETRSLINELKKMLDDYEKGVAERNLQRIVPDIEKQIEMHEQREKIRVCQSDLEETNANIHNEEKRMTEIILEQQKLGAADPMTGPLIDEIRIKLNHLQTHRDDLVEAITELCQDHAHPSLHSFPDLVPIQSSSDPNKSLFRVPKPLKIRSRYYTIRELLGTGGFAQVFRAEYRKPGQEMEIHAFKKFPFLQLGDHEASVVADEIEIMHALDHPNIIKLIAVSDNPNSVDGNGKNLGIGMMMEFCEKGSLRKFIERSLLSSSLPEMDVVIHILADVADGMKYLHGFEPRAIIHRDIKSDNILLDKDMNAKICDFGIARIVETTMVKGRTITAGTIQYKAPEAFKGVFEPCSDVYSFGCVILEILTGKRPWDGLSDTEIMLKVYGEKKEPHDFSLIRKDAPAELVELMKQCLDYDKEKRPTIDEIIVRLDKLVPPVLTIDLDPSSDEFGAIESLFFPSGKEGSLSRTESRIVKITKVRNEFTESLFETEKANIKREMKNDDVNERLLFHGTRQADPFVVAKHRHGMMKDYSGDGFYGKGIYFAELPRYSNDGRYRHKTENWQFQLLLCSVICGNSLEMGQRVDQTTRGFSQRMLPMDKHSVIAGPHRPSEPGSGEDDSRMVVIYKDSQCTPRYIITYEN